MSINDTIQNKLAKDKIYNDPEFDEMYNQWILMYDCWRGDYAIKEKGIKYLPKTSGQNKNNKLYQEYISRAEYENFINPAINRAKSILTRKPYSLALPSQFPDNYNEVIGLNNSSLNQSINEIYQNMLLYSSRLFSVMHINNSDPNSLPVILNYNSFNLRIVKKILVDGEEIIYGIGLYLPVYQSRNKGVEAVDRYTILGLRYIAEEDNEGFPEIIDPNNFEYYIKTNLTSSEFYSFDFENPIIEDNEIVMFNSLTLNRIPGVIYAYDRISTESIPPVMLPLANKTLSAYRSSADLEEYMHRIAFPIYVITGSGNDDLSVNTNSVLFLKPGSTANILEVNGSALEKLQNGYEKKLMQASEMSFTIFDKNSPESGVALQSRIESKTTILSDMAKTLKFVIERLLTNVANMMQLSENDISSIKFNPNTDFTPNETDIQKAIQAYNLFKENGITVQEYHTFISNLELTTSSFDDWLKDIESQNNNNQQN